LLQILEPHLPPTSRFFLSFSLSPESLISSPLPKAISSDKSVVGDSISLSLLVFECDLSPKASHPRTLYLEKEDLYFAKSSFF
ncbi:hypothetical protein TorRG33x02_358210, partial [Trema orientale]